MLSPSWLLICLIEAPDGIYAVFCQVLSQVPQCGLVNNWEGSCTLSKKEKKKPINEPENANKLKCEKSIKFSFNAVTLKKASFILSQFQNNVLNATESRRFRYFPSLWRNNLPGMKVPMGFTVSRQKALANYCAISQEIIILHYEDYVKKF